MHMFLESSSSASRMHTSNSSSVVATTTKSLNISKYDAYYLQVHNQIDSIKKFKLNTDLNYKEKEDQLTEFKKANENLSESYSRLKSENERLKASLEQNEMFKNESFNKIETLQNALKLIRDYMKQIDKRIESYEQTNKIYAKDNETKLKLIDELKLKFQMQTDELKEKIIEFESTNQALLEQNNSLESDLNIKNKVFNDYESKIKQLESNVTQYQQTITQLETSIQSEKAALNDQIQTSNDLETKFNQLKKEHEDELQSKANLLIEFNDHKAEFQTKQQQNNDLNQQIKELKIEILALNDSINEHKQSKSQLISDLDDYKLKFQNQQDLNQQLNNENHLNALYIIEKNDLESKLAKDLNELKNLFDNISLTNADLTKRLEETQFEITKLIEDNKSIENNLNEHKTLLIKQKEEVIVQSEINSCLIDELNKTRQLVADKTSLANKLAQSIEELNKNHDESITNLKIEFETKLKDETSQLNVKHNELFEQLATFLLDGLVEKDEKMQELLSFNEQLNTKQSLELKDLSNLFRKETDAKIANLKDKLNKEQAKIDQLNDDNKSLKSDFKQANNQIKELSNEIEIQKKTVQKLAAENKSLTQSKQKQEDGFQSKIKDLNAKIEQLKADLKSKTEEIKIAKKDHSYEIANLNSILDEAKNEIKNVQIEVKKLTAANLKLQTDLNQSKKIEISQLNEIKRVPKRPRDEVSSDDIESVTSSDCQTQTLYRDTKVIIKENREKVHIAAIKDSILDEIEKSKNDSNQKFLLTTKPQRTLKNRYESVIKSSTPTKRLVPLDSLKMSAIKKKEQHGL